MITINQRIYKIVLKKIKKNKLNLLVLHYYEIIGLFD